MKKCRDRDAGFKVLVALKAVRGERTESDDAAGYGVYPTPFQSRQQDFLDGAADTFR